MISKRPLAGEYSPYFQGYVDQVEGTDFLHQLRDTSIFDELDALTPVQWAYRYAPDKWSIKEIVQHLSDTERVFAYRALRVARNDKTNMAGFDQDAFVEAGEADLKSSRYLLEEFSIVRAATVSLFKSLGQVELDQVGMASETPTSVLALGFIMLGHQLHHMKIIKELYVGA